VNSDGTTVVNSYDPNTLEFDFDYIFNDDGPLKPTPQKEQIQVTATSGSKWVPDNNDLTTPKSASSNFFVNLKDPCIDDAYASIVPPGSG